MNFKFPFKWCHFAPDIILWGVRALLPLSHQLPQIGGDDVQAGVEVDHSRPYRWVQEYAPEVENKYLYRAVDSKGNTLDFLLTAIAECFGGETIFPQSDKRYPHSRATSN